MEKKDIPKLVVLAATVASLLKLDKTLHSATRRALTFVALTLARHILEIEVTLPDGDPAKRKGAAEKLVQVKGDLEKLAFFADRPTPPEGG